MARTNTNNGGGGGGGAFSDITGNPNEIAYFAADGSGTSDGLLTRDAGNFNFLAETPVDTGIAVRFFTDFDGAIVGNPGIGNVYEDTVSGISSGLFTTAGASPGDEATQMVWTQTTVLSAVVVDSLNATLTWIDSATGYSSLMSATDVGMNATNTDPSNGLTQGFGFGSNRAQFNRVDSNLAYDEVRMSFESGAAEVRVRDSGGAVDGMRWTMSDDNFFIDSDESTTSFQVNRSTDEIILKANQTTIDSGQIINSREVLDADTTIGLDDYMVTGASINTVDRIFSLPAIGTGAGEAERGVAFVIKNKGQSIENIILTPAGADTIDEQATITITPGQSYIVTSDGDDDWETQAAFLPFNENATPRFKEITITSAQILDIFDTPVELIPAPGSGKVIKVTSVVAVMNANTIGYVSNGLYLKIGSSVVFSDNTILGLTTQVPRDLLGILPVALPTDTALTATSVVSDPTTGDGDLRLRITYQIINV